MLCAKPPESLHPGGTGPQAKPATVCPDSGEHGLLGSETQGAEEAATDETSGAQLQGQGRLDVLALAPQEVPLPPGPKYPSSSPSLPHLMCVF